MYAVGAVHNASAWAAWRKSKFHRKKKKQRVRKNKTLEKKGQKIA